MNVIIWSPPGSPERRRQREELAQRLVDEVFAEVYRQRAEEERFDDSAVRGLEVPVRRRRGGR